MISLDQVEDQLKKVRCNFRFWGRPEIRELANILTTGEEIAQCVNGQYEGGIALLVATNHRLLLIDKKLLFLTVEDVRFDMIAEIDYSVRLLNATVRIVTPSRTLVFTAWGLARVRILINYAQQRITELRQHYITQQFQPQMQTATQAIPRAALAASMVGGVALQTSSYMPRLPINPYTHIPLMLRRRRVPKFY